MEDRPTNGQGESGSGRSAPAFDSGIRPRNQLLTVVVEDYFHVAPLKSVVRADRWYRFERRVESNTRKALDLLDEYETSATFFVLGSIADEMPELIREIADRSNDRSSEARWQLTRNGKGRRRSTQMGIGHAAEAEFRRISSVVSRLLIIL